VDEELQLLLRRVQADQTDVWAWISYITSLIRLGAVHLIAGNPTRFGTATMRSPKGEAA
jgi:hypothetical protein